MAGDDCTGTVNNISAHAFLFFLHSSVKYENVIDIWLYYWLYIYIFKVYFSLLYFDFEPTTSPFQLLEL